MLINRFVGRPGSIAGEGRSTQSPRSATVAWLTSCHGTLVSADVPLALAPPRPCWVAARKLSAAMMEYARQSGDRRALDHAIALLRHARDSGPAVPTVRQTLGHHLGVALLRRYDLTSRRDDLDAALQAGGPEARSALPTTE